MAGEYRSVNGLYKSVGGGNLDITVCPVIHLLWSVRHLLIELMIAEATPLSAPLITQHTPSRTHSRLQGIHQKTEGSTEEIRTVDKKPQQCIQTQPSSTSPAESYGNTSQISLDYGETHRSFPPLSSCGP
jgi:hypothetical protein